MARLALSLPRHQHRFRACAAWHGIWHRWHRIINGAHGTPAWRRRCAQSDAVQQRSKAAQKQGAGAYQNFAFSIWNSSAQPSPSLLSANICALGCGSHSKLAANNTCVWHGMATRFRSSACTIFAARCTARCASRRLWHAISTLCYSALSRQHSSCASLFRLYRFMRHRQWIWIWRAMLCRASPSACTAATHVPAHCASHALCLLLVSGKSRRWVSSSRAASALTLLHRACALFPLPPCATSCNLRGESWRFYASRRHRGGVNRGVFSAAAAAQHNSRRRSAACVI